MSVFDEQPPIINVSSFSSWLKKNYSFFKSKSIKLSRLNSERDINLLINGFSTKQYVVKISNPKESLVQLEYQDLLINHLRQNIQLRKIYPEILHKKIFFLAIHYSFAKLYKIGILNKSTIINNTKIQKNILCLFLQA